MVNFSIFGAALLGTATAVAAVDYPPPPPIFEAAPYTKFHRKSGTSRLSIIDVPFTGTDGAADFVKMYRIDLNGDAYQRGFAHGALLAPEIVHFVDVGLTAYYVKEVMGLDVDSLGLPDILAKKLKIAQVKAAAKAPEIFNEALEWVYNKELEFMPEELVTEMEAVADGMCSVLGCDVAEWSPKIKQVNMLPELIRMACTMYGAWGKATPDGGLVQLRALDFGGGPFANSTVVQVHHPSGDRSFASVSFPGMVGAITGVSQDGIGISEKVDMKYGGYSSLYPGSYDGEPDVFVLRDVLQHSKTREEAEAYVNSVPRTWAIWMGVGDPTSQRMDIIEYKQESALVYTDETMGEKTGQPYIEDVIYVDRHPQPSGDGPTGTLPTALQDHYGDIDIQATQQIIQYHETGDVHAAVYDYKNKVMYVTIGKTDAEGEYGPNDEGKAYNRPMLSWKFDDLWAGRN